MVYSLLDSLIPAEEHILEISLHRLCYHPFITHGQSTCVFLWPVIHVTLCREFVSVFVNIMTYLSSLPGPLQQVFTVQWQYHVWQLWVTLCPGQEQVVQM